MSRPAKYNDMPSGACPSCGQPSDDDICALAAEFRRHFPDWSSRRCFDRAWIAAVKGAKPTKPVKAEPVTKEPAKKAKKKGVRK